MSRLQSLSWYTATDGMQPRIQNLLARLWFPGGLSEAGRMTRAEVRTRLAAMSDRELLTLPEFGPKRLAVLRAWCREAQEASLNGTKAHPGVVSRPTYVYISVEGDAGHLTIDGPLSLLVEVLAAFQPPAAARPDAEAVVDMEA